MYLAQQEFDGALRHAANPIDIVTGERRTGVDLSLCWTDRTRSAASLLPRLSSSEVQYRRTGGIEQPTAVAGFLDVELWRL
jgi:hypothetical protein